MARSSAKANASKAAGIASSYGLSILKHRRLVCLLALLALSLGLTYFVYAKAVYYAKAQVTYKMFDLPINADTTTAQSNFHRLQRTLMIQLRSRYLIERTAQRLGLVESTGTYATITRRFVRGVSINLLDEATIMVEVEAYHPEIAAVWTEAMIAEYRGYQAEQRVRYSNEAIATFMAELKRVSLKLDESLAAKAAFEASTRFTEMSIEQMKLTQGVRELYVVEQKLEAAERARPDLVANRNSPLEVLARIGLYRIESDVSNVPNLVRRSENTSPIRVSQPDPTESVVVLPGTQQKPAIWEGLRRDRERLVDQRSEKLKVLGRDHDEIKAINSEISLLDKRIEGEMVAAIETFEREYAQLKQRREELRDSRPEYRRVSAIVAKNQQDYAFLEDGSLLWDKAYKDLKGKIDALEFGGEKERTILQYAGLEKLRDEPISPNKLKLLLSSLALAFALGICIPIGLEHFNSTASKVEEIEQAIGIQGLGIVPVTRQNELENIVRSPELDARIPNSLLENFRVIRSGIALQNTGERESEVIMVTSACPSEGKTVNSCNLGWAFASLDEPTLIIDSDLRRGRVHTVLDIPNAVGLTSVLSGQVTMENAIQQTRVPNLWALTRGPIIAGSTERMCVDDYEREIEDLRLRFKRIVLDTPPVLGLSETGSLMRLADGVVLVIRAERTTHRDLVAAVTLLRKAGARFFGFVLNRLDLTRVENYYNYYYYSSHYYAEMSDGPRSGGPSARPPRTRIPRPAGEPEAQGS